MSDEKQEVGRLSERRKAAELVDLFGSYQPCKEDVISDYDYHEMARRSALELAKQMLEYLTIDGFPLEIEYWKNVVKEIELLKIKTKQNGNTI